MSDADRSRRLEELFTRLFDASADERSTALASPANADVAAEMRELLAAHDRLDAGRSGFLERLDTRIAGALVDAADTPPAVTAIGRYPVIRPLARGGMGVVYLARDPRLGRLVALKLLPPSRSADPDAAERLFAEARAASALDHPNIGTVYEIAEADDGRLFIAMAYYEGETLRERMARGALAREEAVAFGIQLADGLAAAHAHGIVHRDIKPENLIITPSGVLKIVDFGVATSAGDSAGGRIARGTPAYMSPEQARGDAVDHRTDVWSAGVVLHEMLTGARPAASEAAGPPPVRGVPTGLARAVQRCLATDPDLRLADAAALAVELRAAGGHPKRRRLVLRLAAAATAAAAVVIVLIPRRDAPASLAVSAEGVNPAVAVLPFEVRGGDLEIWREGMVDLITSNVDGVAGLRAIDSRTMLVGWNREVEQGGPLDLDRALTLARATGATYAVFGSVVASGQNIRVDARIHGLDEAPSLGAVHVEGPADSIFALVDRLSIELLSTIWQGRERAAAEFDLARITTGSLPALKAYLNGEQALRRADFMGAVAAYEQAVTMDSTFAFALYRLGVTRGWIGDQVDGYAELASQALRQAWRHSSRLPERERLILRGALDLHVPQPHDYTTTLALLRNVTRRYPDDPDAWYLLGEITFHGADQLLIGHAESEAAFTRAVELDSGFALSYVHLIHNAFGWRPDSARAARLIRIYRRLAPGSMVGSDNELAFQLAFGDSAHRRRALASVASDSSGAYASYGTLDHPRFWRIGAEAIDAVPRPDNAFGRYLTFERFRFLAGMGRVREALALLADPMMFPTVPPAASYQMSQAGLPIPRTLLETSLAMPATDVLNDSLGAMTRFFHAGALAADRRRWGDHAAGVARVRARAGRLLASGDSAGARLAAGMADALEGYGHWRRGDGERALALMSAGQRRTTWNGSFGRAMINGTIRWWLGDMLEEMNRPAEALRYFESFPKDAPAAWRRARLYETLGDTAKAREAYELVTLAWRDADPELRPRVEEARAAARRLGGSAARQ